MLSRSYSTRRRLGLLPGVLLVLLSCGGHPDAAKGKEPRVSSGEALAERRATVKPSVEKDEIVRELEKAYLALVVESAPEKATNLGIHTRDTELNDRSLSGIEKVTLLEEALLLRAENAERTLRDEGSTLSGQATTDLALLKSALRVSIKKRREFRAHEREPAFYLEPLSAIFLMSAREYAPANERMANVIARIGKIPNLIVQAKTNLKNPPKVWTEIGIQAAHSAKVFCNEQGAIAKKVLPERAKEIDATVKQAVDAFGDYETFLRKDVLPRSNGTFRSGKAYFEELLREEYFLTQTSDDLLGIGKKIFDTTREEMLRVGKRIDPKLTTIPAALAYAKSKHPKPGELRTVYTKEVARARAFLAEKDLVSFPPNEACLVVDTPIFQRATISAAYDDPPPFDPVTKGIFYVTPIDLALPKAKIEEALRENDYGDIVDTVVHEAYPGHHLQLSFSRLHPSLIRKMVGPAIFSEGWALYSEELMSELGYYNDIERLMQLEWTLVRAARVLIDIGLHVGNMTEQEARDILVKDVGLGPDLAKSEVRRYTSNPTQPLAYLIGREQIFAIREKYKAREGAKYSLKRFHDEILSHGTIPPDLVEREMFAESK